MHVGLTQGGVNVGSIFEQSRSFVATLMATLSGLSHGIPLARALVCASGHAAMIMLLWRKALQVRVCLSSSKPYTPNIVSWSQAPHTYVLDCHSKVHYSQTIISYFKHSS